MTTSSAERYRRAKAIADQALDLEQDQRDEFLARQCGDDQALRAEVSWLIEAAQDESSDAVPERFQSAARQVLREVSLEVPLPRNYRLLRRLSEGGEGVVYLAERDDGGLHQPVALKLLSLSNTPDESLRHRFATERRILSRLNHPNIAHLIDGGLISEGRPFLATEYVDGLPIDQWCRQHQCSLRQRVEIFIKVCNAVDYAHRHMVIHRDLKPSNILVTADGEPKLLDFGIAHVLDDQETGEDCATGSKQMLTLAYASPEQVAGRGLSATTDVYSLGMVLYGLIAGQSVFENIDDPERLFELVREGRIEPPGVNSDLDAIVMKAVCRNRDERYATVRDLIDDLQRFLEFRPVRARDGQWLYRTHRFVRRNRWAVAGLGVLAGLLTAFLIDRESQMRQIAWERDRAEAVNEFMHELFAGADSLPTRGQEVTVRDVLDLGALQLATADELDPGMLSSINLAIGRAYNALGLGEQALPLLEQARFTQALTSTPEESGMIMAELGAAFDSAGRALEAIEADRQAIEWLEQAEGGFDARILQLRIRMLRNHANVLDRPLDQTIAELEAIHEQLDQAAQSPELQFEAKAALVGAYVFAGRTEQALDTAAAARALAEELYSRDDPRYLRGQFVQATALMLDNPEAAADLFERLIKDHERLIGPSQRLANTIGNYGVALSRLDRNAEAMAAFDRSARMMRELVGRDHYLYRLSMTNQAALQLRQSNPRRAESLISEVIEAQRQRHARHGGIESVYLASALDIQATARAQQGQIDQARADWEEALELLGGESMDDWVELQKSIETKLEHARADRLSGMH
jgi:eukaryotic-like serine/threonine-protein kinase